MTTTLSPFVFAIDDERRALLDNLQESYLLDEIVEHFHFNDEETPVWWDFKKFEANVAHPYVDDSGFRLLVTYSDYDGRITVTDEAVRWRITFLHFQFAEGNEDGEVHVWFGRSVDVQFEGSLQGLKAFLDVFATED